MLHQLFGAALQTGFTYVNSKLIASATSCWYGSMTGRNCSETCEILCISMRMISSLDNEGCSLFFVAGGPSGQLWMWARPLPTGDAAVGGVRRLLMSPEAQCLSFGMFLLQ